VQADGLRLQGRGIELLIFRRKKDCAQKMFKRRYLSKDGSAIRFVGKTGPISGKRGAPRQIEGKEKGC